MAKIRYLFAGLILIVSLGFGLWGFWPRDNAARSLDLTPSDLSIEDQTGSISSASPGVFSSSGAHLELDWQPVIRKGDAGQVRLTLHVNGQDNPVSGSTSTNQMNQGSSAYHVLAEARLEIAGQQVDPADSISQSVIPNEETVFAWTLRPQETGVNEGTAWFILHFLPIGGGQELQKTISAQRFEVQSIDMLGWDGNSVRLAGFAGVALGLLVASVELLPKLFHHPKKKNRRG